jgi:hypothetical protein
MARDLKHRRWVVLNGYQALKRKEDGTVFHRVETSNEPTTLRGGRGRYRVRNNLLGAAVQI